MSARSPLRLVLEGLFFAGCLAYLAWGAIAWLAEDAIEGKVAVGIGLVVIAWRWGLRRRRARGGARVRRYTVSALEGAGVVQRAGALEEAWTAAGLVVRRRRRRILVGWPGGERAIVRVPRSETLGGEPFEIFASDRYLVVAMLDAASPLLGDLRCSADGEPGELRFYYVAAKLRAAA